MNTRFIVLSLLSALVILPAGAAGRHGKVSETPVRATLGDGQVLMGEVHTRTLVLQSGTGTLEIPLADVGEVVPATGGQLGEAEGKVDVWLKNGSELRGTWADPKLAMSIQVGGNDVPIDLPMNELSRFQLQGAARWPGGPVYRMRTRFGDDFLVDPARTHLVIVNDLGTFSPLLSECAYVAPVNEPQGIWRVKLQTGTVLLGHLQDDRVTVALPMGPEEVSVPLDQFVSLKVESWVPVAAARPQAPVDVVPEMPYPQQTESREAYGSPARAEAVVVEADRGGWDRRVPTSRVADAPAPAPVEAAESDDWFDSSAMAATKKAQE